MGVGALAQALQLGDTVQEVRSVFAHDSPRDPVQARLQRRPSPPVYGATPGR